MIPTSEVTELRRLLIFASGGGLNGKLELKHEKQILNGVSLIVAANPSISLSDAFTASARSLPTGLLSDSTITTLREIMVSRGNGATWLKSTRNISIGRKVAASSHGWMRTRKFYSPRNSASEQE